MSTLFMTIMGILLAALIAFAGYWWGGDVFTDSKIKSDYTGILNAGQQIEGALRFHYSDTGSYPPGGLEDGELLDYLISEKYLREKPQGDWKVNPSRLIRPIANQTTAECKKMNKVAGFTPDSDLNAAPYEGCPPCSVSETSSHSAIAIKYNRYPICQLLE